LPVFKNNEMTSYPPAYPHGDIEEIGSDIFMLRGSIKMNPAVRITRNMAVLRRGTELTLVNPLRLNERGERQLAALGKVTNLLRLGAMHGVDDPYYVDKFSARMWSQAGGSTYTSPAIDVELTASTELPFDGGSLFFYQGTTQPECALLMADGDGILLSCDAVQHYGDYSYCNLPAKLMMPLLGFARTTIVGPIWLKLMTPAGGSLKEQFERLLELRFERLLAAHGTLLSSGAHASVERAVGRAFAD